MRFSSPGWLVGGICAALALLWLWRRHDSRQQIALAKFVGAQLRGQLTRSVSAAKRRWQRGLLLAALLSLFAALAEPLLGFRWEQVNRRGNEIIFALDTSRSMLTPDVKPNRLVRAKLAIDDFAKQLDGDAVGIVAFAGTAFLACPITLDYGAFHESLAAIDTNTIPRGGTNISSAILAAQAALHRRAGSDKILIILTDGEDLEGSALDAARAASQTDGLKIYTVGVGTAAGDLIPLAGQGGFVKDDAGALVKSRLDEEGLKAIAGTADGFYVPLGNQAEGLQLIFKTVLGTIAKHDIASRQQKIYTERYQWPLAASVLLLLASLTLGTRRRPGARAQALAAAVAVTLMCAPQSRSARAADSAAPAAPLAKPSTTDAKKPVFEYNAGTAAYRAGRFPQAAQSFQQSIGHAPSSDGQLLQVQQDAYYNLGNTLYRDGQKTEKSSTEATLQKWNEAVKAYDTALQLRADDADSKFNRDLVKRKIEQLQNKQNQDNQNNKNQQNKDQSKDQPNKDPNKDPGQKPPTGQPPPGQNPPPEQNAPPGQNSPGQKPPPAQAPPSGQSPSPGQNPPADKGSGQPPSEPPGGNKDEPGRGEGGNAAEGERVPGQMTREEARELLDSVKGDERRNPAVPVGQQGRVQPPDKPYKNW